MRAAFEAFLKILLVLVVALIFVHFAPFIAVPLAAVLALILAVAAVVLTVGGIAGAAVLFGLLLTATVLAAALSPIWIPVAAILGIIWLIKKLSSSKARPAPAA